MLISSAYANKMIKQKREEIFELINAERENSTTTAVSDEDVTALRKMYNFKDTQDKINILNADILSLKHAINVFNATYVLPELGYTIDVALVKMSMLTEQKARLGRMKIVPEITRKKQLYGANKPEYIYRNYDDKEVQKEYDKVVNELTKIQLELDKANLLNSLEV